MLFSGLCITSFSGELLKVDESCWNSLTGDTWALTLFKRRICVIDSRLISVCKPFLFVDEFILRQRRVNPKRMRQRIWRQSYDSFLHLWSSSSFCPWRSAPPRWLVGKQHKFGSWSWTRHTRLFTSTDLLLPHLWIHGRWRSHWNELLSPWNFAVWNAGASRPSASGGRKKQGEK